MNQEFFADGFSAVHVTGPLVRIDLMTVQPHLKSDNGQPVIEVNQRIIMPLDGFIQSLTVQDDIVKKLLEAGVLKRGPISAVAGPLGVVPSNTVELNKDEAKTEKQDTKE